MLLEGKLFLCVQNMMGPQRARSLLCICWMIYCLSRRNSPINEEPPFLFVDLDDMYHSISLKKTFTASDFSDLLGEIRSRLEYTEDEEGERTPVK